MNKAMLTVSVDRLTNLFQGQAIEAVVVPGQDEVFFNQLLITSLHYDHVRNALDIIVMHPSFPEYADNQKLVELQVRYA